MTTDAPVTLRPVREEDWRAVHVWASTPDFSRYQAWGPNTEEQTRAFAEDAVASWRARPQVTWVWTVLLEDRVVGNAELTLRSSTHAEIGYGVDPAHQGRGIATAVGRLLLRQAFEDLGVHRVVATCDPRNVASAAVLRRLGLRHEGRLRETVLLTDGWRDSDLYAVLVHEWSPGTR